MRLLWWLNDDPRLSVTARAAIHPKAVPVWVSAVTGYELRLKQRLGKLRGVPEDLLATLERQGFTPLGRLEKPLVSARCDLIR